MGCSSYDDVYDFWFGNPIKGNFGLWFGPGNDDLIREKFGDLVKKARDGELQSWEDLSSGPKAAMAFVILLDQFCRSIYRNTADMFSHDHKALAVALKLIDSGKHKELSMFERFFLYLPVEHDESKESSVKSCELFAELLEDYKGTEYEVPAKQGVAYSLEHKEVIDRFGRYPRRNAVLGRENTPEEEEILKNWPYDF